jgi:hypothetical protein
MYAPPPLTTINDMKELAGGTVAALMFYAM